MFLRTKLMLLCNVTIKFYFHNDVLINRLLLFLFHKAFVSYAGGSHYNLTLKAVTGNYSVIKKGSSKSVHAYLKLPTHASL